MSIYATLWNLKFPKDGGYAFDEDEWVEVCAQAVPGHIDYVRPQWEWLPPPTGDEERPRAVFIVGPGTSKGTERNGQEYVDPLVVLSGEEYERIGWRELWDRIAEALGRDQGAAHGYHEVEEVTIHAAGL